MEILKELGIETQHEKVDAIKASCPTVFENASMIFCPLTDELIEDGFFTISNSNGFIHGKVANKNSVIQMSELIDIAYNVNLNYDLNLQFAKAKLHYYNDESCGEITIPLGTSEFRTRNGFEDKTNIWLFIKTGFGGVSCSEVGIFTKRLVCTNGMEIRHGLSYFKCKHTEKMNEKLKTFLGKVLPDFTTSVQDFTGMSMKLDSKDITNEDIEAFRNDFFDIKKDEKISTKKANMMEAFNRGMAIEMGRVGQTAWGLLQSATHYTNHGHPRASEEFVATGTGGTLNAKAEKFVLAL
jgi:hypothetical protein